MKNFKIILLGLEFPMAVWKINFHTLSHVGLVSSHIKNLKRRLLGIKVLQATQVYIYTYSGHPGGVLRVML